MVYDVCVIGSGPAGGVLSKELAEAGAKVALVEAGRMMTGQDFHYHAWPYQRAYTQRLETYGPRNAYPPEVTKAIRYENSDRIWVDRIRAVGGRSIHWNAVCLRFADRDFRERSLQGVEEDWPLSYQELSPFYSYVEKMIGVTGMRDHLEIVPDGEYLRLHDQYGNRRLTQLEFEKQRADVAEMRTEEEKRRGEALAEKLLSLGINPEQI